MIAKIVVVPKASRRRALLGVLRFSAEVEMKLFRGTGCKSEEGQLVLSQVRVSNHLG